MTLVVVHGKQRQRDGLRVDRYDSNNTARTVARGGRLRAYTRMYRWTYEGAERRHVQGRGRGGDQVRRDEACDTTDASGSSRSSSTAASALWHSGRLEIRDLWHGGRCPCSRDRSEHRTTRELLQRAATAASKYGCERLLLAKSSAKKGMKGTYRLSECTCTIRPPSQYVIPA